MSTTILASTTQPDAGTTISTATVYALDTVLQASCINPVDGLLTPCQVELQFSADGGTTYAAADRRTFRISGKSFETFRFVETADKPIVTSSYWIGSTLRPYGVAPVAFRPPWTHYRLVFSGNTSPSGTGVTVSVVADSGPLAASGGSGTVTSIVAGTGLTGGTITTTGTIALSTPVSVANGGTGAATLTAHGVLVGAGTSAVAPTAAGTSGQLLIGQGATSDPTFNTVSGDVTITGAGAVTIANNAVTTAKINAAAVTYAKVQNVSAHALLGNSTGSAAAPAEITLGSGLSFSGTTIVAGAAAVNANALEVSLCGAP